MGFMSAAVAARVPTIVRTPRESAIIRPFSMLSSVSWLVGRPYRRPMVESFASALLRLVALAAHRLLEVDHHHDRGLDGGAEEGDEADPDGDRKVVAERVEQVDPAREGEGHGQQYLRRVEERAVRQVEQDVGHHQHDRDHDLQPLARADLVLVLPAPLQVRAGWKRDSVGDQLARLVHEAPDVAAADVQENGHHQQPVLARDHRRATHAPDVGELGERYLRAVWGRHQDAPEGPATGSAWRRGTYPGGEPLAPF